MLLVTWFRIQKGYCWTVTIRTPKLYTGTPPTLQQDRTLLYESGAEIADLVLLRDTRRGQVLFVALVT